MSECEVLSQKIKALAKVNNEIISRILKPESFTRTTYQLKQKHKNENGIPNFEVKQINEILKTKLHFIKNIHKRNFRFFGHFKL